MIKYKRQVLENYFTKRVSFIIATKNRASSLENTLKMLSDIKTQKDELIIVDGLSSDNTLAVCKKYNKLIDKIISEKDLSPAHAINKGILVSSGRYIKQIGDEDTHYKKSIDEAVSVLDKHPEVDLLICGGTKQYGKKYKTVLLPKGINYGSKPEDVFKYGASGVGFFTRKSLMAKAGTFPIGPAADLEFVLHCIALGSKVKFCRINLYNHPVNSSSVVMRQKKKYLKHFYALMKQNCSPKFYYTYRIKKFISNVIFEINTTIANSELLTIVTYPYLILKRRITPQVDSPLLNKSRDSWDCQFS